MDRRDAEMAPEMTSRIAADGADTGKADGEHHGYDPHSREQLTRPAETSGERVPSEVVQGGKTIGQHASEVGNFKRFLVIRNGRGIIADGDDMEELRRNYTAASESAPEVPRSERGGWAVHTWPAFASLARCDHEGETGKVCIVDAEEAPDAVSSYYGVGFVR